MDVDAGYKESLIRNLVGATAKDLIFEKWKKLHPDESVRFLLKSRVMQRNFSLRGDMKSRFSFIPQFDVGD